MILKEETLADGPLYRRVPSTREAIHNALIKKLVDRGVDESTINITSEEIAKDGRCCPQVKVTAVGDKPSKKTTVKKDDEKEV